MKTLLKQIKSLHTDEVVGLILIGCMVAVIAWMMYMGTCSLIDTINQIVKL